MDGTGRSGASAQPRTVGLVDLRGAAGAALELRYPADAVVVVSGLPGSGKSTLLRRWSAAVPVVDPRDVHEACEAVMPERLPYGVYRPWARLVHLNWLRSGIRDGGPLLVHDCGSRPWLRRWLARGARRQGRELHLVVLDIGPEQSLAGQRARGRWAPRRAFARHCAGLGRLVGALTLAGSAGTGVVPTVVAEVTSVVLLDVDSRALVTAAFDYPAV
ncbi:AAA family ATPase [Kitasatospora sp. NPDC094015]|uniref:AAA family ATPase n=1 Tax=Kitasatospora sp. NPDC094015 TaxID=3155205 RepID=UPI00332BD8DF